jgi:hypothetical protein
VTKGIENGRDDGETSTGRASRRRERDGTDKPPAETRSALGVGFTPPLLLIFHHQALF